MQRLEARLASMALAPKLANRQSGLGNGQLGVGYWPLMPNILTIGQCPPPNVSWPLLSQQVVGQHARQRSCQSIKKMIGQWSTRPPG
eukprot:366082-Chlamydomonas_euryale.AAC.33